MCNLGECLVEEGILEGKELKLIENIISLMKNLKQSYEFVAQSLDMSEEDNERIVVVDFVKKSV